MFYQVEGSGDMGGFEIGPVRINLYSFYSSFISSVIMVPAVFALTLIFRNRRLKHAPSVDGEN